MPGSNTKTELSFLHHGVLCMKLTTSNNSNVKENNYD